MLYSLLHNDSNLAEELMLWKIMFATCSANCDHFWLPVTRVLLFLAEKLSANSKDLSRDA